MSDKKLSQTVLKTIEDQEIKPKSKLAFLLKDWVIWAVGAFAIFIGALAISVIIALIRNNDWDLYQEFGQSLPGFLLSTMPYIWIIVLGLFVLLAHYQIQHTKHGYRYPIYALVLVIVGMSSVFGVLFYQVGVGQAVNHRLNEGSSIYRQFMDKKADRWAHPEEGFLFGEVKQLVDEHHFEVLDFDGGEWNVSTLETLDESRFQIEEGIRLRILGEKIGEGQFEAERLLPWDIREKGKERLRQHFSERRFHPLRNR